MKKISITLILLVAIVGCQKASTQSSEPAQKIRVSYTTQPQSTLIHVAVAKGYFVEEGLEVESLIASYGKASLQTLIDNKSDFAAVAETPFMFNVLKGEKIFIIANIEATSTNNAVVARKDAGITTAADLKGKRIGYTAGTTSDFFLDSLLTANGMTRKEIRPINLKPEEMQEAILSKKVDAVCTWNYPLTQIKHLLGTNGAILFDKEIYTETYNVAAQQRFVQNHPETVKRFLRALIKSEKFVATNPDEAQTIMSAATKVDKNIIKEVWDTFSNHVVLEQSLLITLEDETRWAITNKLTDQTVMPDYKSYIHTDSLRQVKPEAVSIY